jgi:large subunit ribosomal protein L6
MKIQKKFIVKIPENILIIYSNKKKLISFILLKKHKKSLELKTKIFYDSVQNLIKISALPFSKISSNDKKKLKTWQGTTVATIKYILTELSVSFFCQKIRFIGVGYRAFPLLVDKTQLLRLRLGYSHQIYFRFLHEISIFCLKFTKLFIMGNSYQQITQFTALLRSCKPPEPYKGKGILYEKEKILLKIGKKV